MDQTIKVETFLECGGDDDDDENISEGGRSSNGKISDEGEDVSSVIHTNSMLPPVFRVHRMKTHNTQRNNGHKYIYQYGYGHGYIKYQSQVLSYSTTQHLLDKLLKKFGSKAKVAIFKYLCS